MPFNVIDINGRHIGVIARTYPGNYKMLLVAVTEQRAEDTGFDMNVIEDTVATALDCKNLIGKIKEDKFEKTLREKLNNEYRDSGIKDMRIFKKYLYMKTPYAKSTKYIEETLNIKIDEERLQGYLMLDRDNIELSDDNIVIKDEIDYLEEIKLLGSIPVFCKVMDYPIQRTGIMGAGEGILLGANWSDFGGRNHSHTTRLKIKSGNFNLNKFDIPIYINVKKGMIVQIYLEGEKIKKIFCDDVIYEIY